MENEIKTIGEELVKAVETMKEEGAKTVQKVVEKTTQKVSKGIQKPAKPNKVEKPKTGKANELQKEIERKTAELHKCLAELERKKQLSNNRTAFMHALDKLKEAADRLKTETGFESALYKLKFGDATSYGNNDIFSISNSFILSEFIAFIREKIQLKIAEIEKQLITE